MRRQRTPLSVKASPAVLLRGAGRVRRPDRPRSRVHNRNHQVRLLPPPHQLSAYGETAQLDGVALDEAADTMFYSPSVHCSLRPPPCRVIRGRSRIRMHLG